MYTYHNCYAHTFELAVPVDDTFRVEISMNTESLTQYY